MDGGEGLWFCDHRSIADNNLLRLEVSTYPLTGGLTTGADDDVEQAMAYDLFLSLQQQLGISLLKFLGWYFLQMTAFINALFQVA